MNLQDFLPTIVPGPSAEGRIDHVTKSELIEEVAQQMGISKGRAEMAVNAIFESMVDALAGGEGIEIRGFGSFAVRQYKAYEGRNPRTGSVVHVPPKRLPFFKVGKDLRNRINSGSSCPSDEQQRGAGAGQARPSSDVGATRARPNASGQSRTGTRSRGSRPVDGRESEDSI